MDIDLNPPNAERSAPPAAPPGRHRHRLPPARKTRTIRLGDRASIAFGLVQEARQIYPAEDDCPTPAVTHRKRS